MGLLGTGPSGVPHVFDYREQPSFSLHDLPWSPMGRFKQLLNKEGRGDMRPGRNSQEQPWGKILFPHQWIHTKISLSYFSGTETPSRWEKLMINYMLPMNFQMFKLDLEKAEESEIKLPTSVGSLKKQESSRKASTSGLLTMPKPLTVWITINCRKF